MDSIIGLTLNRLLIFLVLGVFASMCQEAIAGFLGARALYLARGLQTLLGRSELADGTPFIKKIYDHGLIHSLYIDSGRSRPQNVFIRKLLKLPSFEHFESLDNTNSLPSHIPSRAFAMAMMDILSQDHLNGKAPLVKIEASLLDLHRSARSKDTNRLAESLLSMLVDATNEEDAFSAFEQNLEGWFDSTMDQVSTCYKRFAERSLLIIGLVFAFAFNVDAIHVARVQSRNADINQTIQSVQDSYVKEYFKNSLPSKTRQEGYFIVNLTSAEKDAVNARLTASLGITNPFGWRYSLEEYRWLLAHPRDWKIAQLLNQAAGWLITAYAASLFARLWFDFSSKMAPGWTNRKDREVKDGVR